MLPCHQCGQQNHSPPLPGEAASPVLTIVCGGQPEAQLRDLQLANPDVGPILRGKEVVRNHQSQSLWQMVPATIAFIRCGSNPSSRMESYGVFSFEDGNTSHLQLVTPIVLHKIHGGTMAAHLGEDKTPAKLKERYYWAGLYQ